MRCFVITYHNVFKVWPKTTLLLLMWCRGTKNFDPLLRDIAKPSAEACKLDKSRDEFLPVWYTAVFLVVDQGIGI